MSPCRQEVLANMIIGECVYSTQRMSSQRYNDEWEKAVQHLWSACYPSTFISFTEKVRITISLHHGTRHSNCRMVLERPFVMVLQEEGRKYHKYQRELRCISRSRTFDSRTVWQESPRKREPSKHARHCPIVERKARGSCTEE